MKTESGVKARYILKRLAIICLCLASYASFASAQESSQILVSSGQIINQAGNGIEEGNKISIRSALRINKKSYRHIVEIIVQSERRFPTGAESYMLHVGKQGFMFDRYGDTRTRVLIFELTPQEFEKIKNGDEVTVTYGGAPANNDEGPRRKWKFGKLEKFKLDQ